VLANKYHAFQRNCLPKQQFESTHLVHPNQASKLFIACPFVRCDPAPAKHIIRMRLVNFPHRLWARLLPAVDLISLHFEGGDLAGLLCCWLELRRWLFFQLGKSIYTKCYSISKAIQFSVDGLSRCKPKIGACIAHLWHDTTLRPLRRTHD